MVIIRRKCINWKLFSLSILAVMAAAGPVDSASTEGDRQRKIEGIQQKIQQAERDYLADKARLEDQIETDRQTLRDFDGFRPEIRAKVAERQTLRDRISELESSPNGRRYAFVEIRRLQSQVDALTSEIVDLRRLAEERTRALTVQIENGESELQQTTQTYEQYVASLEQELQELSS